MNERITIVMPIAVFALVIAIAAMFWGFAYRSELRQIENETQVTVEQVGLRIDSWIQARVRTVEHQAENLDLDDDPDLDNFVRHAKAHTELNPGYQAINWIDSQGIIKKTIPKKGNEAALGQNLFEHPFPSVSEALRKAADSRQVSCTPATIELFQGGRGFAMYWPIFGADDELAGFVNGVFKVDDLVAFCLNENVVNPHRFRYRVSEGDGTPIYDSAVGYAADSLAPFSSPHRSRTTIPVADRTWHLTLEPLPSILPGASFARFDYIIPASLILGVVLAWMAYVILKKNTLLLLTTKRYQDLYEKAPMAYFSVDLGKRIKRVNRSACTMLGYSRDDLLGRGIMDLYANTENGKNKAAALFEKGKRGDIIQGEELEMVRADGTEIWIALSVTWVQGLKGELVESRSSAMDITDKVRARERQAVLDEHLYQSRKMESLGVLAGGIAHEFNNLLMSIMGNTELLRMELKDEPVVQAHGKEIDTASHRAADLCRQMVAYAGQAPTVLGPVNLNQIIDGMRLLIETQISVTVELNYAFDEKLPEVTADPSHLQQCILDLVTNAVESLATTNGTVSISTTTRETDAPAEGEIRVLASDRDGPFASIRVADTGPGVERTMLSRMFEPFSSTKFMGRGLGLSSLHGIVRRHSGAILAQIDEGQGMYIEILFPKSDRSSS